MIEGEVREPVTIGSIAKLEISPGDKIIANVEIGKMPPGRVRDYINEVKTSLKRFFPENTDLLVNAMRDGKPAVEITVIKGPYFGAP